METFGSELRRLRRVAGLTQRETARRARVSPTYLNDLEHDNRLPRDSVARTLAAALGHPGSCADSRRLRELAFLARGECCPRCGFGGEAEHA